MKYYVLKAYGKTPQLEIIDDAIPLLLEDDILVEVSYSAINDYDWSLSTGIPFLYRLMFGLLRPKLKPGMEICKLIAHHRLVTSFIYILIELFYQHLCIFQR